jgi:hypothetical protein
LSVSVGDKMTLLFTPNLKWNRMVFVSILFGSEREMRSHVQDQKYREWVHLAEDSCSLVLKGGAGRTLKY